MHRGAVGLAGDIPQRLVDAGDGTGQYRAVTVEAASAEHLPGVGDPQRVRADEVLGEDLDRCPHRLGPALNHRLTPADDAVVGLDPAEQPARRDQERLDPCDPHSLLLPGQAESFTTLHPPSTIRLVPVT